MSRAGYSDDCEQWDLIRWRGAVNSAIKGTRGQQFLRELLEALDAMPEKKLIANELKVDGAFCTLGVIGAKRGVDLEKLDPYDREGVASIMNVAPALAAEIMYENDEVVTHWEYVEVELCGPLRSQFESHRRTVQVPTHREAERRWQYMRQWVASHISAGTVKSPARPK